MSRHHEYPTGQLTVRTWESLTVEERDRVRRTGLDGLDGRGWPRMSPQRALARVRGEDAQAQALERRAEARRRRRKAARAARRRNRT